MPGHQSPNIGTLSGNLVLLLLLLTAGCAPDALQPLPVGPSQGWRVFHPVPVGYDLAAVWGDRADDIWSVGDYGVIVHWDGNSEILVESPVHTDLTAIDGWNSRDIYAVGQDMLLHYDGITWEIVRTFADQVILDLLCAPDHRLYVVGTVGVQYLENGPWQTLEGPTTTAGSIWIGPDGLVRIGDLSEIWRVQNGAAMLEYDFEDTVVRLGDGAFVVTGSEDNSLMEVHRFQSAQGWGEHVQYSSDIQGIIDWSGSPIYATSWYIYQGDEVIKQYSPGRWLLGLAGYGDLDILACGYGGTLIRGDLDAPESFSWHESAAEIGYHHIEAFSGFSCDDFWTTDYNNRVLHYDATGWTREFIDHWNDIVRDIQDLGHGWVVAQGDENLSLRHPDGSWHLLPGNGIEFHHFHALTPDSIFATDVDGMYFWNGDSWSKVAATDHAFQSMAATRDGVMYTLEGGASSTLLRWDGTSFEPVAFFSDFSGQMLTASRDNNDLWLGGTTLLGGYRSVIFRYRDGEILDTTSSASLPPNIMAMSELRPDDLFVLAHEEVWRYHAGYWQRETGLPEAQPYFTLWCCPEGGVFVEGIPTFFKDFSRE